LESKGPRRGSWFRLFFALRMEACPAPGAVHPDIVPADVLAADAGRGLRAAECATMLDGYLRRLARQEARARRVLGTLAHGFLRRHHHHDLGFARRGEVLELARCMCGGEVAPWDAAEAIAAEGLSARGVEPDDPLAGLPDPVPTPLPDYESRTPMPALDWSAVEEALPDDVEAL